MALVDEIANRKSAMPQVLNTAQVTQLVYSQDIQPLNNALSEYLSAGKKEDVWLLFDNLDKGWPIGGATSQDILLLRSLLEATRKLQRQFENRGVECHAVVFIRNDIWQHLVLDPADRGKDTAVLLDWNDPDVFKEILRRRIIGSTGLDGDFASLWACLFDSHVLGEESFSFILNRTLMRPRELLRFVRECVDTAVSRGHEKVLESDILHAEKSYADDAFVDISMELRDINPAYADVLYGFMECRPWMSKAEAEQRILKIGLASDEVAKVLELLIWFGFLGILAGPEEERYSYQFQHDLKKMYVTLQNCTFCVHPVFRTTIGCGEQ